MKNRLITLLIIVLISLCGICLVWSKLAGTHDSREYAIGLDYYKKGEYYDAYKHFGKVSLFSSIKTPALFRQARCATLVGDYNGAKRNYNRILYRYPYSQLYVVSEYNLAMLLYESDKQSARKHFVHIIKYYPETDYALASEYYVANIDMETAQKTRFYWRRKNLKKKSLNHFIRYVKLSPNGRFVQPSINAISKLGIVITHQDSFALADSYFKRQLYAEAEPYYKNSPLSIAWAKYAKNEFKLGNGSAGKLLVENGLRYFSANVDKKDMYDAVDGYVKLSDNKLSTVNNLLYRYPKTKCADYLIYLKAKYSPESERYKIYEKLYDKYPDSSFSAEALFNTFYANIDKKDYDKALKLAHKHMTHFKKSDTSPAVYFWTGKIHEYKNNKLLANNYYKSTISRYPDSYYSYRAYIKLYGDIKSYTPIAKPIVFPCDNKDEQAMAGKLIALGDYDFVSELYKGNKFVDSWVAYKQGKIVQSVIIAEKAMKKLYPKPDFSDVRWRLVYPLNYYDIVNRYKHDNPMIIMSVMREESHFNKEIQSPVGALGLMQLMPATANEMASAYRLDNNLLNPETNIRLGSLYFSKLTTSLQNSDIYAVIAYNGGISSVNNWLGKNNYRDLDDFIEKIPYPETQSYVKKVMRSYWGYMNVY